MPALALAGSFWSGAPLGAQPDPGESWGWEWPRTDFSRHTIDLGEIRSGGPPKDAIPAIDAPVLQSVEAASKWLHPGEPVIVLAIADEVRAYPIQVLIWHEIVNDQLGGVPVAVTFCPLCNSSLVFDRRVGKRVLSFGTTGKLRRSDLVMYDDQTESWWQQLSGEAIVGELAGLRLAQLPASIVAFETFAAAYPAATVLSRETGYSRPYGENPYRGYDAIDSRPFLFEDPTDPRLPPMERVLAVVRGETRRIYPFRQLARTPVINDEIEGLAIVVFAEPGALSALDEAEIARSRRILSATAFERRVDDRVLRFEWDDGTIRDTQTRSAWNLLGQAVSGPLRGRQMVATQGGVHFAFAWLAFHPDSRIYDRRPGGEDRDAD